MERLSFEGIDPPTAKALRAMPIDEKLAMMECANRIGRILIAVGVRERHPQWTNDEVLQEVNRMWLERNVQSGADLEYVETVPSGLGRRNIWRDVLASSDGPEPPFRAPAV